MAEQAPPSSSVCDVPVNAAGGKKRWSCRQCIHTKSFSSRSHLTRHVRCFHAKELRFKCPLPDCTRQYHRRDAYRAHLISSHMHLPPCDRELVIVELQTLTMPGEKLPDLDVAVPATTKRPSTPHTSSPSLPAAPASTVASQQQDMAMQQLRAILLSQQLANSNARPTMPHFPSHFPSPLMNFGPSLMNFGPTPHGIPPSAMMQFQSLGLGFPAPAPHPGMFYPQQLPLSLASMMAYPNGFRPSFSLANMMSLASAPQPMLQPNLLYKMVLVGLLKACDRLELEICHFQYNSEASLEVGSRISALSRQC